jgi:hypothetical protein
MPSCKLTKRVVDALPSPAGQDQIWWDEDLKGFGLKISEPEHVHLHRVPTIVWDTAAPSQHERRSSAAVSSMVQ